MVNRIPVQVSEATTRRRTMRRRGGHTSSSRRGGAMLLILVGVGVFALLSGVFLEAVNFNTPSGAASPAVTRITTSPSVSGGSQTGPTISVTSGTAVVDRATLSGATSTAGSTLAAGTPGMNFGGDEANIWNMTYAQQLGVFARVKASGAKWIRWTVPMAGEEIAPGRFKLVHSARTTGSGGLGIEG